MSEKAKERSRQWLSDDVFDLGSDDDMSSEDNWLLSDFQKVKCQEREAVEHLRIAARAEGLGLTVEVINKLELLESTAKWQSQRAATLLTHYLKRSNPDWGFENSSEIGDIVDYIVSASSADAQAKVLVG